MPPGFMINIAPGSGIG